MAAQPCVNNLAAHQLSAELDVFLIEAEGCLVNIDEILHFCDKSDVTTLDGVLQQAEWLLRDIILIEEFLPQPEGEILTQAVSSVVTGVRSMLDAACLSQSRGRPAFDITETQLALFLDHHFKICDIARLLNVSARTIRRRIIQFGLEDVASYSTMSDAELDEITRDFVHQHPHSGRRSYAGYLRSRGFRIQQQRIRESLMRIDNRGMERRFRRALHRRRYNVCMPNSLWHIDGYHKLIRWRIVVHGGIDGYSRLPVFLRASTNNRASTVLHCFLTAVERHGLPSRVRCDKGGENVMVSDFMLGHPMRGPGRGSCITGRSVHNQRIERFWRDLYPSCIALYHMLFWSLEDCNLLNIESNLDLFCLHYIFLPRICRDLDSFRHSYSHHSLRTAQSRTPHQLWISGMLRNSGDSAAVQGLDEATSVSAVCFEM